jgi:hypothetical protein
LLEHTAASLASLKPFIGKSIGGRDE